MNIFTMLACVIVLFVTAVVLAYATIRLYKKAPTDYYSQQDPFEKMIMRDDDDR